MPGAPSLTPDAFIAEWGAAELKERPAWLAHAHDALDRAVAAAYGWPEDIDAADALARLLALNAARAARPASLTPAPPPPARAG